MERLRFRCAQGLAQNLGGSAGGGGTGCKCDFADSSVAVAASAVWARRGDPGGDAQYGYGRALDVARAGFELCVFCRVAFAGGPGSCCIDDGSTAFFSSADSA